MPNMPKIGDLVQIKHDLEGCTHINPYMKKYQGEIARVTDVFRPDCYVPRTVTFGVHLDIASGWYWYEDTLILNPNDRFNC